MLVYEIFNNFIIKRKLAKKLISKQTQAFKKNENSNMPTRTRLNLTKLIFVLTY